MATTPFADDKPVRIEVRTGRDLAEVFLIDHSFKLVERGVGALTAEVKPGVYKVKAHLGAITFEQLVVLSEDRVGDGDAIDLSPHLGVVSPVPIQGTALSHEYQAALAADESRSVDVEAGKGAEIFLMTRRWSGREGMEAAGEPELTGLTLHDAGGTLIADLLEAKSPIAAERDAAAGATVAVDPGPYLLRWADRSGIAAEQSLYAVPGWQTQVFLVEEALGGEAVNRHIVSVLLSRQPFDPTDPKLELVEEARAALAEERKVATEYINESLFGDFENPMLGLFGAHLMLITDAALHRNEVENERLGEEAARGPTAPVQFDQGGFDQVVAKLRDVLGESHPDVIALSTRTSDPVAPPRLTHPPMLWKSWQLLVEASNDEPQLVPAETWRQTLGVLPLRPFFVWSPAENRGEMAERWEEQIASALEDSAPAQPERLADDLQDLSHELMAPRAVIDDLLPPEKPLGERRPEPA